MYVKVKSADKQLRTVAYKSRGASLYVRDKFYLIPQRLLAIMLKCFFKS